MLGRIMPPLVLVTGALACAPPAGDTAASMEADMQAVRAVRDQEVAGFNAGEVTFAHGTANIVVMPPAEPAVVGTEAAANWARAFLAEFKVNLRYTTDNFMVSGDWAVEHYAGSVTLTPAAGGAAVEEQLKGIHVYQRQADGSWKMTHDIWNFDAPPPAP